MSYYLIKDFLQDSTIEECAKREFPYVAVVTSREFDENNSFFDMGIDMEVEYEHPGLTKAVVNYDSLTGCFSIPDRKDLFGEHHKFSFALDEKGIAFINDDGTAQALIDKVKATRKWRDPSLERFIYDFLERIVENDLKFFECMDKQLDEMEDGILKGEIDDVMEPLLDFRGQVLEMHTHYEQLMDLIQEFLENENGFFHQKNLRFFDMFLNRINRLNDLATSMRERVMQVRDLYHTQLEVRQNKISTVLTIVATIFMPLTLIVGWYGMNFKYMPELERPWAYPTVIGISVLIVIISITFFKKKKWL